MQDSCYLVLSKKGRYGALKVRATSKKPATKSNEIAIKISMDIPDTLFERPQLQAKIKIDASKGPAVIDADVAENLAEIIKQETGLTVNYFSVDGVPGLNAKQAIADSIGS